MALMQAVSKRVLEAEAAAPGTVLDHAFLDRAQHGFEDFRPTSTDLDDDDGADGHRPDAHEIDELADALHGCRSGDHHLGDGHHPAQEGGRARSRRSSTCCCCAATSASRAPAPRPIRGHSNVQGDRTMGIWEKMPDGSSTRSQKEFDFDPPRSTASTRSRPSTAMAARRDQGLHSDGRQLRGRHLRHVGRRGGDPWHRADGSGVDQAEPFARRHRRGGPDPADARPHRDRQAGSPASSSSRSRTRSARCTRRAASRAGRARTCCPRSRSFPGSRAPLSATDHASTGRGSSTTTT